MDVSNRRKADVADRGLGRLKWADSSPSGTASGRTGVHAKAVIPLRARNRLHRPKRKTLPRIEAAFARIGGLPDMRTLNDAGGGYGMIPRCDGSSQAREGGAYGLCSLAGARWARFRDTLAHGQKRTFPRSPILSGQWIDRVHASRPFRPEALCSDMEVLSVSPTHGEQEMKASGTATTAAPAPKRIYKPRRGLSDDFQSCPKPRDGRSFCRHRGIK